MVTSSKILLIYKNRKQVEPFLNNFISIRREIFMNSMHLGYRILCLLIHKVLGWDLLPQTIKIDASKSVPRSVDEYDSNDLVILDNVSMIESMELGIFRKKSSLFTTIEICRYEEAAIIIGSQPDGTYRKTMLLLPELGIDSVIENDEVINHMANKFRDANFSTSLIGA